MEKYLYDDLFRLEDVHWWHISKRRTVRNLISKFQNGNKLKILDMGCGTGKNIEELSFFGEVFGIDKSRKAITSCKKRGLLNVRLGNTYKTGFSNNKFNLVTLLDVLEHTDEHKTIKEAGRILVNNGEILITVPTYSWLWSRWDEVLHHKRRYNKNMLKSLLEKEGFQIIKISYLYSFLVAPTFFVRSVKVFVSKKGYSSDFRFNHPIINKLMLLFCDIERFLMLRFSIPFGTSLVVLAKKI